MSFLRNLKKDVCANYDYGTEEDNLRGAVRRYLYMYR
jgi:hypothetical protein